MSVEQAVKQRANCCCELCGSEHNCTVHAVAPQSIDHPDHCVYVCEHCDAQINDRQPLEANHWHCLNESMWSEVSSVQVMAWRILNRLSNESWAQNLQDMLYMSDETRAWAEHDMATETNEVTRDSNGTQLNAGDNVTLIKDLVVKGANFTAKRGTAVRNINLSNNPKHIEGRVNGTRIVIISAFVKKSSSQLD